MPYFVYSILNTLNGKIYIGKTSNPQKRWRDHCRLSLNDSLDCPKLYGAIRKYGINFFEFSPFQEFNLEQDSLDAEIYYIKYFDSINFGYNCLEDVGSRIGYITSEETKQLQKLSRLNYYKNNTHFYLGKERDKDTKIKISNALTGKYVGENSSNTNLTDLQRLQIIKLSGQGLSQRSIAKLFNVSQWSIYNILKKKEIYLRELNEEI